jgi:hypothetical protein
MVLSSRCNIGKSHNRRIVSNFFLKSNEVQEFIYYNDKWNEPHDEIKIMLYAKILLISIFILLTFRCRLKNLYNQNYESLF